MKVAEPLEQTKSRRVNLRPLSASTYLLRNASKAVPLTLVIILAVMLVAGIVSLMNSIPLSIRTIYNYAQEMVVIGPRGDPTQTPRLEKILMSETPVPLERTMLVRSSMTQVKSIVGKWPFAVTGMTPDDLKFMLKRQGVQDVTGRLPNVGKPEVVISEPVSRNLGLKIGSVLQSPENNDSYSAQPVKVVGIAQTKRWLMLGDRQYQMDNHFPPIDIILAFAHSPKEQSELDHWVVKRFKKEKASLFAFHILEKDTQDMFKILYKILNVVIGTLVIVITVMMGMLINIYQGQRLVEYGLLQALGYTKRSLFLRTLKETLILIAFGWLLGVVAAYGLLKFAEAALTYPSAFALDTTDPLAYGYTLPIPLSIVSVAVYTVVSRFRNFDPVSVVERRLV